MSELPTTYTGPGLFDIQVNGYAGHDFNDDPAGWDAGSFAEPAEAMRRRGVAAALPTFITDAPDRMEARCRRFAEIVATDADLAAFYPGLHIEGPFISPETGPRGAHPRAYCTTPAEMPDLMDRLRAASSDRLAIVTIAPELPGSVELIRRLAGDGLCVALGHHQGTPEQIRQAVDAGARLATHLGNGSHQQLPRLDNYLQTQLAEDRLMASFIADGHHMPLTTLQNFLRAKTFERSILITDAMLAAELAPGEYPFGGRITVVREDGRVFRRGEDNLAGSSATLDACVLNACCGAGVSFEQAWAMASTNPCRLLGLPPRAEVTVTLSDDGFRAERRRGADRRHG